MPKPRIVVVSPFIDKRHGTERSVAECLQRLSGAYDIHVYSNRLEDLDLQAIRWHRVPAIPGPHLIAYLWWFVANGLWRWRDSKFLGIVPEVVFSPGINCLDADVIQVHVVFAQLREHMKRQLTFRSNPWKAWHQILHRRIYYSLIAFLERRIYPRRDLHLIAVSRKTANDLTQYYCRSGNIQVAHHGIDLSRFRPEVRVALRPAARGMLELGPVDFTLLLIGNDWKSKGLACVLKAVASLQDPAFKILVVGTDNPAPFQQSIREGDLSRQIRFLPPRPDVEFYYAVADAYVSPTLEDSFGLPPAEAMASGLPVITSGLAGVSEIMTSGEDSFVLEDPADFAALARVLLRLKTDFVLRERIASAAVQTASKLTWDDAAEHLGAAWEAARAEKAANSHR